MERVSRGVQQLRLDNVAFEGENNAYLLDGDQGPLTLIDTGISTPETEDTLRAGLNDRGLDVADIERVFLTHFHLDHSGLAGLIQRESGADVYAHTDEIPMIGDSDAARSALREAYEEGMAGWALPEEKRSELEATLMDARDRAGRPVDAIELDIDAPYDTASGEITPVALPGHTLGHVGYRLSDGALVAGDALLPVYTPNIGGADPRVPRPLETYLQTLGDLVRMDPPHVWPGHRDRIVDPVGRAHEIREHHRDRTVRVLNVLEERGRMTVWEMATALFGSLSNIHILHGPGEAHAHLDHLVGRGVATVSDEHYELRADRIDHEDVVPTLT